MKKTLYCLAILALWSCQKEPSFEIVSKPPQTLDSTGESPDGAQLSRIVFQHNADDSTYTDYTFDAAGQWNGFETIGDGDAFTEFQKAVISRDADGIITKLELTKINSATGTEQNLEYAVQYNTIAQQYTSRVAVIDWNGTEAMDSTVFVYNASGKISDMRVFLQLDPHAPYEEWARAEFEYDINDNLVLSRSYVQSTVTPGTFTPVSENIFTYDDKKAPLTLGNEALLCDQLMHVSPASITNVAYKDLINGTTENAMDFIYNYHPSGKPKSGLLTTYGDELKLYFRYHP